MAKAPFLIGGRVSYLAAMPGAVATLVGLTGLRAQGLRRSTPQADDHCRRPHLTAGLEPTLLPMRIVQPLLPGAPPTSVVGAQLVTGVEPPQRTESRQPDQRRAPTGRRPSGRHEFLEAEHLGATEVLGSPGRARIDVTDQAV
ncbi:MAG TPA: hypothetical protein VK586_02825, partial [Streptosporangiaceae bacterium]|nr:hypothetical protein [Streptosporangiaceae bacterium]